MKKFIDNFEVAGVIGNPTESRVFLVEERESRGKFALKALPLLSKLWIRLPSSNAPIL
jgi:hypothetical protein